MIDDLGGCGGCASSVPTVLAGPLPVGPLPASVFVVGSNAHVASSSSSFSGGGLFVVDVSNPSAPIVQSGPGDTGGVANKVFVHGSHAFLSGPDPQGNGNGLYVFDISDPTAPTRHGAR